MNKIFILALCAIVFLFVGCAQSVKYVCSDGSVVKDNSKCPPTEQYSEPTVTTPPPTATDVFTIKKDESIDFDGKSVTLVDVFRDGRTIVDVSGVTREIQSTKYLEIINGLDVVVQTIDYVSLNPDASSATLKLNLFVPNATEYLFFVDQPQVVDDVQVTLRGVTSSYIIVDTQGVLGMKIYPGSSKLFSGLNITNVKAFPRGVRLEDYAILRIFRV